MAKKNVIEQMIGVLRTPIAQRKGVAIPPNECAIWAEELERYLVIEKEKKDQLETKEVDVEKESELIANSIMISVQANLYHTNVYNYEKRCYKHSDLKDAARKGIEFGLKAQK